MTQLNTIVNDLTYVNYRPEFYSKLINRYCHRFTHYTMQSAFLFGNQCSNQLFEQVCVADQLWSAPSGGKLMYVCEANIKKKLCVLY